MDHDAPGCVIARRARSDGDHPEWRRPDHVGLACSRVTAPFKQSQASSDEAQLIAPARGASLILKALQRSARREVQALRRLGPRQRLFFVPAAH
jgi:hypothetical protein